MPQKSSSSPRWIPRGSKPVISRSNLRPEIEVIEVEAHLNDSLFAETVVEVFDNLYRNRGR